MDFVIYLVPVMFLFKLSLNNDFFIKDFLFGGRKFEPPPPDVSMEKMGNWFRDRCEENYIFILLSVVSIALSLILPILGLFTAAWLWFALIILIGIVQNIAAFKQDDFVLDLTTGLDFFVLGIIIIFYLLMPNLG